MTKIKYNDDYHNKAREHARKYRVSNKNRIRKASLAYYKTIEGRVARLYNTTKQNAKKRKYKHTLTKEWIHHQLQRGYCEVTKIPFDLTTGNGHNPFSPSIDRINNHKGYVPENCRLVILIYNLAKADFTDKAVNEMAKALVHYCCDCGHSLTMHGPSDETNRLPCREIDCPCNAYGE
jgi:hypothetical protein